MEQPYRYQRDIPVWFACGCQATWHDGGTLHWGAYAWCERHQDTSVTTIHAQPHPDTDPELLAWELEHKG